MNTMNISVEDILATNDQFDDEIISRLKTILESYDVCMELMKESIFCVDSEFECDINRWKNSVNNLRNYLVSTGLYTDYFMYNFDCACIGSKGGGFLCGGIYHIIIIRQIDGKYKPFIFDSQSYYCLPIKDVQLKKGVYGILILMVYFTCPYCCKDTWFNVRIDKLNGKKSI